MTEQIPPSDAEFFRQRGFGLKIGFGERPALLVIDMLKAFTNPHMMLGANLDKEIEAIKPLLAIAASAIFRSSSRQLFTMTPT